MTPTRNERLYRCAGCGHKSPYLWEWRCRHWCIGCYYRIGRPEAA